MRQTYSAVLVISWRAAFISGLFPTHTPFYRESSLQWTDVSQSAIVLHWQGADSKLKPTLIATTEGLSCSYFPLCSDVNTTPEVLDIEGQNSFGQCEEESIEHFEEFADVQSAVGML